MHGFSINSTLQTTVEKMLSMLKMFREQLDGKIYETGCRASIMHLLRINMYPAAN